MEGHTLNRLGWPGAKAIKVVSPLILMTLTGEKGTYVSRFEDPIALTILIHLVPEPQANKRSPRDILER